MESDSIESRSGHIRLLRGANYYISMRKLLKSNGKLRTLSLVIYSKISIEQIEEAAKTIPAVAHDVVSKAESPYGDLCLSTLPFLPSENDAVVIFYVTGYCCRLLATLNRYEKCRKAKTADVGRNQDVEIALRLFTELNRGGL